MCRWGKKEGNVPSICSDLLVWALVELGRRWVVIAVTLGELRGGTIVSQKRSFLMITQKNSMAALQTYLEDTPSVVNLCSEWVS